MILSFLFESMTEFSALIRISGLICSPTPQALCADSNQQYTAAAFSCLKDVLSPVMPES